MCVLNVPDVPDLTETGLKLRDRKRNERIASLQKYEIGKVKERGKVV